MPILYKSKLSSSVANATFLDKTIDDVKKGILTLYKVNISDPETITDVQDYINEIASISGIDGEGDALATTYSSEQIIANGDDRKIAIGKLDAQVKVNLDNITTNTDDIATNASDIADIQTILNDGEILIKSYADDASYELENGVLPFVGKTAIYYNSTSGLLRYYDDVATTWEDVGKTPIGKHEFLGYGNGVTVDFSITNLPLTDESFVVYRNGLKVPKSEYSFSTPTITFSTAPYAGQAIDVWILTEGSPTLSTVVAGTQVVEYKTLDATDVSNKYITLPSTPADVTKVILDIIKGSSQQYGVDYNVSGTQLSWNGLALDGVLNIGDILRYHYFA